MIISLNWLKKYTDIDIPVSELSTLIGSRLVEVEDTINISKKYQDAVIVRVVKCDKVEDSDHLSLALIDDGSTAKDIERDDDGLVQVICGAPNVHAEMLAVWLPPKSVVPASFGSEEPFVLGSKKIMNYTSNGMLASVKELDLGDAHDGIAEISPSLAKAGDRFASVFDFENDVLFDIENKSLTHRPDCFGVIGFAREVAGILGKSFKAEDWLIGDAQEINSLDEVSIDIKIEDPELCPRYEAVVMSIEEDSTGNYLLPMQTYVARSGMRTIDRIVDVTNEMMLLTGQPLHAFDYDKLVKVGGLPEAKINVRAAKKDETLELLDGKTIKLDESDILICSNDKPVALAGAMGGKSTMIDKSTRRIVIESATFNLYNLRTTQMRHGIFSEAITRFTKGQPPKLTDYVLRKSIRAFEEYCGAKAVSAIFDNYAKKITNKPITLTIDDVNSLLGTNFSYGQVEESLENVGFEISCSCGKTGSCECEEIDVTAPYWRTDIHIREDVIEEVGRLNGFDNITPNLPTREFVMPVKDELGDMKSRIRHTLASAGANEVLTYSFINSDLLAKAGQDASKSYQVINSISPDLEFCRQSLTPSLLTKTYMNIKSGFDSFALFELNKIHSKSYELEDKVPAEKNHVGFVMVDRTQKQEGAYYKAKMYAEYLFSQLGITTEYQQLESDSATAKPFEPKRSAMICDKKTKTPLGIVGEYKTKTKKNFKLPDNLAGFELSVDSIMNVVPEKQFTYQPLSKYPNVERDICFKTEEGIQYAELFNLIQEELIGMNLVFKILPIDIYQAKGESTKNTTFRLIFADKDKTLNKDDITDIMNKLSTSASDKLGAEVI